MRARMTGHKQSDFLCTSTKRHRGRRLETQVRRDRARGRSRLNIDNRATSRKRDTVPLYASIVVSVHLYVHWLPHAGPHNGASMHSVPFAGPPRIKGPPAGPPLSSRCSIFLCFSTSSGGRRTQIAGCGIDSRHRLSLDHALEPEGGVSCCRRPP